MTTSDPFDKQPTTSPTPGGGRSTSATTALVLLALVAVAALVVAALVLSNRGDSGTAGPSPAPTPTAVADGTPTPTPTEPTPPPTEPTPSEVPSATETPTATPVTAPCTREAIMPVVETVPHAPELRIVDVQISECRNGYARAFAIPDDTACEQGGPCYEQEQVFLADVDGTWTIIGSGTGITCQPGEQLTPEMQRACTALGLR